MLPGGDFEQGRGGCDVEDERWDFENIFLGEHITLDMLLDLREEEILDMFKCLGIGMGSTAQVEKSS